MSSTPQVPKSSSQPESESTSNSPPLALPSTETAANEDGTRKLDMSSGSATVNLDHLGPMVVNEDGTLSRISNWDQMAEIERKNTLRVLGKRNKLRMDALKAKEAAGEKESS